MVDQDNSSQEVQSIDKEDAPYFEFVPGITKEIRDACEQLAATNPKKYRGAKPQHERHGSSFEAQNYSSSLVNDLIRLEGEEKQVLLKSLQNSPLVVLCAGNTWAQGSPGVTFADQYGASSYIGVDHANEIHGAYDSNELTKHGYNSLNSAVTVRGDVREFLRNLPNNSVNLMMAGVDENIWNDDPESEGCVPAGYVEEVKDLIIDRCKNGGVILLDQCSRRILGLDYAQPINLEEVHERILQKKL